jgi:hypothetical protein
MSIIAEALQKAQQNRSEKYDASKILFKKADGSDVTPSGDGKETGKSRNSLIFIPGISIPKIVAVNPGMTAAIFAMVIGVGLGAGFLVRSGSPTSSSVGPKQALEAPSSSVEKGAVPFKHHSSNASQERVSLPVLSGIMYSPRNPQAIVNGILSSEGGTVDGFVLLKILPDTVRVKRGQMQYELKLR